MNPSLLYPWVPKYPRYLILTFLALVVLCANGIFPGTTQDIFSGLGEQVEWYTLASNAMYIGMGLGMMFLQKLTFRFSRKKLLITGLCCLLVFNVLCAIIQSPQLVVLCCFLLGFSKTLALGGIFIDWLFIWSDKLDSSRLYPFFYFLALSGSYFLAWLTSMLSSDYNWQYSYLIVLIAVLLSILFCIILVQEMEMPRKIPLYQSDLLGIVLISLALMCLNYVFVFGKVEDWYNSERIFFASLGAVVFLLLFVKRETAVKRPFFNLSIFRSRSFTLGLFLFIQLGVFGSSSVQSGFSLSVLRYEQIANLETNLYLIPGVLIGSILCFIYYKAGFNSEWAILAGFLLFVIYHTLMYLQFGKSFEFSDYLFPSLLRGAAFSTLYISIALYTRRFSEPGIILKVAGSMVIFRSFVGSGIFNGLYGYYLYTQRVRHLDYLSGNVQLGNQRHDDLVTSAALSNELQTQANLAAFKEITGFIIIYGLILLTLLSIYFIYTFNRDKPSAISGSGN